jgi:hypothetical protein
MDVMGIHMEAGENADALLDVKPVHHAALGVKPPPCTPNVR